VGFVSGVYACGGVVGWFGKAYLLAHKFGIAALHTVEKYGFGQAK
jgi:hypothetical protein